MGGGATGQFERDGGCPRLPIGVTSFRKMAEEGFYFVDKTLLIRDVIDDGAEVVLFTRPRRFGKTLNMDMLRVFFELPIEGGGEGGDAAVLFRDKAIWACGERYTAHQGAYPVVFLTFKDVKFPAWSETLGEIAHLVQLEALRHGYLLESAACNEVERSGLARLCRGEGSTVELAGALYLLTAMLEKHHGRPAIIIIDEYDAPIQQGHLHGYYGEAVDFMRVFFSRGLKDNPSLYKGFMTGVLRVAKEGILSGLNNLVVESVLDARYASYFGFTPDEVRAMARRYGAEDRYDEICSWYDGYRFGKAELFNPWSVLSYLHNGCEAQPYWVSTSNNAILGEILSKAPAQTLKDLRGLIEGGSVLTSVEIGTVYPRIADDPSSVWSYLLMTGYLNAVDRIRTPIGSMLYRLAIPNREVNLVYRSEVLSTFCDVVPAAQVGPVQGAVMAGDAAGLQHALGELLARITSVRDPAGEGFYHGFVLGLVAMLDGLGYKVRSNREAGLGYFDVALEPTASGLPGVVMEFKAIGAREARSIGEDDLDALLDALAAEALAQIDGRDYACELRTSGADMPLLKYGVAFCGKRVRVKSA